MKKLVVVTALALIAGAVNAASVSWSNPTSARITGLDGSNITQAQSKDWGLQALLINTTTGETLQTIGSTTTAAIGKTAGTLTGANYTYTYGDTVKKGDVLSVILKMTVDGQAYELDTGLSMTVTASDNGGTDAFNNSTAWGTTSYGGSTGWAKAGVPEPTSALLLLMGGAMLALRRKRA